MFSRWAFLKWPNIDNIYIMYTYQYVFVLVVSFWVVDCENPVKHSRWWLSVVVLKTFQSRLAQSYREAGACKGPSVENNGNLHRSNEPILHGKLPRIPWSRCDSMAIFRSAKMKAMAHNALTVLQSPNSHCVAVYVTRCLRHYDIRQWFTDLIGR